MNNVGGWHGERGSGYSCGCVVCRVRRGVGGCVPCVACGGDVNVVGGDRGRRVSGNARGCVACRGC